MKISLDDVLLGTGREDGASGIFQSRDGQSFLRRIRDDIKLEQAGLEYLARDDQLRRARAEVPPVRDEDGMLPLSADERQVIAEALELLALATAEDPAMASEAQRRAGLSPWRLEALAERVVRGAQATREVLP